MYLIVDVINIKLEAIDSVIFGVGFFVTCTFALFKIFSKKEVEQEDKGYYSRNNLPIREKEKGEIY